MDVMCNTYKNIVLSMIESLGSILSHFGIDHYYYLVIELCEHVFKYIQIFTTVFKL